MKIHLNLGGLMKEKKISAVKLSKVTGISAEHISLMKNNKTQQIQFKTIKKLLTAFDCELSDLIKITYE